MGIDIDTLILDAEVAAKRARISIADVCKRVGVNRATWQRWKAHRTSPSIDAYNRIVAVTGELQQGASASAGAAE